MLVELFLIGKTNIDWKNLLSITKQTLGRSISQGIDTHHVSADSLAAVVCAYDELFSSNSHPIESLRNAGALLNHIHFSFLVVAGTSVFYDLLQHSDFKINIVESQVSGVSVGLVSGTLLNCKQAITNLINHSEQQIRLFLDKLMLILETEGFREIFAGYKKVMLSDKTFKLIEKK